MKFIAALLVLVIIVAAYETNAHRRYCGTALITMLDKVCKGKVATLRETAGDKYVYHSHRNENNIGSLTSRLLPERVKKSAYHYSRGIVSECCNRSCTLEQMSSYCGI